MASPPQSHFQTSRGVTWAPGVPIPPSSSGQSSSSPPESFRSSLAVSLPPSPEPGPATYPKLGSQGPFPPPYTSPVQLSPKRAAESARSSPRRRKPKSKPEWDSSPQAPAQRSPRPSRPKPILDKRRGFQDSRRSSPRSSPSETARSPIRAPSRASRPQQAAAQQPISPFPAAASLPRRVSQDSSVGSLSQLLKGDNKSPPSHESPRRRRAAPTSSPRPQTESADPNVLQNVTGGPMITRTTSDPVPRRASDDTESDTVRKRCEYLDRTGRASARTSREGTLSRQNSSTRGCSPRSTRSDPTEGGSIMIGSMGPRGRSNLSRCSSDASIASFCEDPTPRLAPTPVVPAERLASLKLSHSPRGLRRSGGAIPPAASIGRIQEDTENGSDSSASTGSAGRPHATGSREQLLQAGGVPAHFDLERTPQAFLLDNRNRRTNHTRCCRCFRCARAFYVDETTPILEFWDFPECVVNCRCFRCYEACPHEGHTLPEKDRCIRGDRHCNCRVGCDDRECDRCMDRVEYLAMSVPSRQGSSRSSVPTETDTSGFRSSFEGRSGGRSSGEIRTSGEIRSSGRCNWDNPRGSLDLPRSPDHSRMGRSSPGLRREDDPPSRLSRTSARRRRGYIE